jgi:3-hydroxyisobutyrate dehydrogenase-like beta-hydroxyacid dehydrogenase
MGGGMAHNFVKSGFPVEGYGLYKPMIAKFVEAGSKGASSPATAAQGVEIS